MTEQQLALDISDTPRTERAGALRSFHVQGQPMPVAEALEGEKRAKRQSRAVLHVFERHRLGARLQPSQVHAILAADLGDRAPLLTSVRRSLTDMADETLAWEDGPPLVHHKDDRRMGPYGRLESTWSLRARLDLAK